MSKTALIVVDVQNDFCPGGRLAVAGGDEIVPLVNDLKRQFEFCVVTQDFHPADHSSFASNHDGATPFSVIEMPYGPQVLWPDHCVQGTEGAEFHPDLDVSPTDLILRKGKNSAVDSYSGFFENDHKTSSRFDDGSTLNEKLRNLGVNQVVICGLAYDFCVGWHALDARQQGFRATVVKSASRSIAMPAGEGTTTETAMDEKLKSAGVTIVTAIDIFAPAQQKSTQLGKPNPF